MQVFNRGMSSSGHLDNEPNRNLVFKEKPNNMGLFLGKVQKFNKNKGLITVKLKEQIKIGDTIALENEQGTYTISELMDNNKNITGVVRNDWIVAGDFFKLSIGESLVVINDSNAISNPSITYNHYYY